MREIEEIIEHQSVVAVEECHLAVTAPCRIVIPMVIRQFRAICESWIAGPYPNEPVFFDDRVAPYLHPRRHPRLARDPYARTAVIVSQSMIAAHEMIAVEPTVRQ